MQGIRPGDVVLNAWAYSTHNGAHAMDEALYRWLNCVVLSTGTGNVTPTRKQIELAVQYGAKAILTTGDYLLHLAETAREMGIDPIEDLQLSALPNIGDKQRLSETFGAAVYDSYGFHEVQWVAIECAAGDGLHIFEDAFIVEIVDVETGDLLPDGEQGAVCITEIYKTGSPQIRYNIMDLSALHPRSQCECGSWLRKMAPFTGRGDNMVKLRGVNIWPEALGEIAMGVPGVSDDYFVVASRTDNRDEMTVKIVSADDPAVFEALAGRVAARLQESNRCTHRSRSGCTRIARPPHRIRYCRQAHPVPGRPMIDYWCNAFTPDREALWAEVIARDGLSIRTRGGDLEDGFCEPAEMVERMDQLGVDTVVLPVCEPESQLAGDSQDQVAFQEFAHYAVRESELKSLVAKYPGRFVGVFSVNPDAGAADLDVAAEAANTASCVGLHSHTHSWDRPFDHPDYWPYYELCAEHSIPFTMQAGASGGNMIHESGHPSAIAKPRQRFSQRVFRAVTYRSALGCRDHRGGLEVLQRVRWNCHSPAPALAGHAR